MLTVTSLKHKVRDMFLGTEIGYRFHLQSKLLSVKRSYPSMRSENAVLRSSQEWESARDEVERLNLPPHRDLPKNWDSLAALDCILRRTDSRATILDAGAELYSVILPWLFLYGYRKLTGINVVLKKNLKRGPIVYEYGDITKTEFKDNMFDAITCLSVIEHGVNVREYFKEMSRILKPGGVLITSTDYYASPVNTKGTIAYGVPVHIFTQAEIAEALEIASELGLELTGPIDLRSEEYVIKWKKLSLDYTFLVFALEKRGRT